MRRSAGGRIFALTMARSMYVSSALALRWDKAPEELAHEDDDLEVEDEVGTGAGTEVDA